MATVLPKVYNVLLAIEGVSALPDLLWVYSFP